MTNRPVATLVTMALALTLAAAPGAPSGEYAAHAADDGLRTTSVSVVLPPLNEYGITAWASVTFLGVPLGYSVDPARTSMRLVGPGKSIVVEDLTVANSFISGRTDLDSDTPTGKWSVQYRIATHTPNASVPGGFLSGETLSGSYPFYVKKHSFIFGMNAAPEPIAAGKKLVVSGTLYGLNSGSVWVPNDDTYPPYKGKKINIYFNPTGPKGNKFLMTVTTDSKGKFRTPGITAKVDGRWIAEFKGTSNYAGDTAEDKVDVR
jgi:hypothetical protein